MGRNMSAEHRRNRLILLATSDLCHLCGHRGAKTADHIITPADWLRRYGSLAGVDSLGNLAPAHGNLGNGPIHNRCTTCGQVCNQVRGNRVIVPVRSRVWDTPRPPARPQSREW